MEWLVPPCLSLTKSGLDLGSGTPFFGRANHYLFYWMQFFLSPSLLFISMGACSHGEYHATEPSEVLHKEALFVSCIYTYIYFLKSENPIQPHLVLCY